MSNTFFCQLSTEGILSVQGIDSKKFLQGQLTCNLNYISTTQSSLGARCTPKGRMVSSFQIIQTSETNYLLNMSQPLIEKQLTDLQKYAMFSKVTLSDNSEQWSIFGLRTTTSQILDCLGIIASDTANHVTEKDGVLLINIAPGYFKLIYPKSLTKDIESILNNHLPQGTINDWNLGLIQNGIPQILLETSELFVPQMVNLPALAGVSFKKGCYTGQEIVARMQYLGKLKRHLYRFTIATDRLPSAGTVVHSKLNTNNVGEVILSAKIAENNIELLAVVLDEAVESSELWLEGYEQIQLSSLPLPYKIDIDQEIKY